MIVFLKSPSTGEIKEVEAFTVEAMTAALTPLMAHGWHQAPAPAPATVEPTRAPVKAAEVHHETPAAAPVVAEHEVKTVEAPAAPEQIKETEDK